MLIFGTSFQFQGAQPLTEKYLQILAALPQESTSAFSEYYWKHSKHQGFIDAIGFISASKDKIEFLALTTKEHLEGLRKQIHQYCHQTVSHWYIDTE